MSHPVWYTTSMTIKEMREMDKAFEDFSKACDNVIGKCQDFIEMDINKSNINYDKLTPYDRKRLEGKGCPPSP